MRSSQARDQSATVLRGFAVVTTVAVIALWVVWFREIFALSQGMPAPTAIMLPIFFCGLALGGAMAAVRGEGIAVALCGGLSLFPMGIFLVAFPGPTRIIGVLDIALIVTGLAIMRRESRALAEGARDPDE